MSSKRYLIIKELERRLQRIQVANDFNTDAGLQIFLGEIPMFGEDDPPGAIAVIVGSDVPKHQGENVVAEMPIEVQALVKIGPAAPLLALETMVEDIKKALELKGEEDPLRNLGGLAMRQGFTRGQTRVLEREPGSTFVGVGVAYQVLVVEAWGTP